MDTSSNNNSVALNVNRADVFESASNALSGGGDHSAYAVQPFYLDGRTPYDEQTVREITDNPAWVQETTYRVAQLSDDVHQVLQAPLRHAVHREYHAGGRYDNAAVHYAPQTEAGEHNFSEPSDAASGNNLPSLATVPQGECYVFYETKVPLPPIPSSPGACPASFTCRSSDGSGREQAAAGEKEPNHCCSTKSPSRNHHLPDVIPSPEKAERARQLACGNSSSCTAVASTRGTESAEIDDATAPEDRESCCSCQLPELFRSPSGMTYPNMSVSDQGTLVINMHPGISVETTIDRAIRVTNHHSSTIACVNVRGSATCVLHPAARVYHHSTSVEAHVYGHRCVRMKTGLINFTRADQSFTLVRDSVKPKTMNLSEIDLNTANSVFGCSSSGEEFKDELCLLSAQSRLTVRDDNITCLYVNRTRIRMHPNGDIDVFQWPRAVRMHYATGEVTVRTHFIRVSVSNYCDVKIERGSSHFSTSGLRTILVSNEWVMTGLDDRDAFFLCPAGVRQTLAPAPPRHRVAGQRDPAPGNYHYLQLDDDDDLSDTDDEDGEDDVTESTLDVSVSSETLESDETSSSVSQASQNKFIIRDCSSDEDDDDCRREPLAIMTSNFRHFSV